jgi:hypothetical protein
LDPDYYQFNWVRIQENATVRSLTDPVTEPGIDFLVHFNMYIEGGGTFVATNVSIQAINITLVAFNQIIPPPCPPSPPPALPCIKG